jgi:hypothetical protein
MGKNKMWWFSRRPKLDHRLLGRWEIDPADEHAVKEFGYVVIDFDDKGRLTYTIKREDKDEIFLMKYQVEEDVIISDQPSHRKSERSRFILADGLLTLWFDGRPSRFLRAPR